MFTKRIIPCLDVSGGRVVKGVKFLDLIDAGDPVEVAKAYNKSLADEIVFLETTDPGLSVQVKNAPACFAGNIGEMLTNHCCPAKHPILIG